MASSTEIANLALAKLGDDNSLRDLGDDTRQGRAIAAVFNAMRDAVLRAHPWNFAARRTSLPASTAAPDWGYARTFPLPADFIRFVEARDERQYQIEDGAIVSDADAPLSIRYIRRVEDTGRFDPLFVEALACRIAMEVAMQLTGSGTIRGDCAGLYKAAITEAKAVDGVENPADLLPEDDWMLAREGDF